MVTHVAFIGLGNMGRPMAANLVRAGFNVTGYDLSADSLARAAGDGIKPEPHVGAAVAGADVVITMLPAGPQVRESYEAEGGLLASARPGTLLIDCSTIDVASARAVAATAATRGFLMLDAPVSGGTAGAEAGSLTFMVGGSTDALDRARPVLSAMGRSIVHAGDAGAGQAAKICNNMILGISMIGVCEAFAMAERLGLDAARLFEVASRSSGQCWSLTSYCPVPGLVPGSPANNQYKPGFAAGMMAKDLRLAVEAASQAGSPVPLGSAAAQIFAIYCAQGGAGVDFSGIIQLFGRSQTYL